MKQLLLRCGFTKRILAALLAALMLLLCGCGNTYTAEQSSAAAQDGSTKDESTQDEAAESAEQTTLDHRYASKEEGISLLLANREYYDGFSQNELEYKMKKKGASMDEYLDYVREQILDFTDEEKALIDGNFDSMENTLKENGYILPELDEIVLVKTTAFEEGEAGGYTHGTQIYLSEYLLEEALYGDEETKEDFLYALDLILWHELFHCLTRCNPDFREKMYELIHFTVTDEDYPLPPSVFEYHISNPDVEHHNSYATFRIDGQDVDCFTDWITTKHFENEDDIFFDFTDTALIPIDGTDIYYTPEQAENFDEIFGKNTEYVTDPEECMADNFAYAMMFGIDGPDSEGYPSPEIIEGILAILNKND